MVSDVQRLKLLYEEHFESSEYTCFPGLALGSETRMVMNLLWSLSNFVIDHFQNSRLSEKDATDAVARHTLCYGIVDGEHYNRDIRYLI